MKNTLQINRAGNILTLFITFYTNVATARGISVSEHNVCLHIKAVELVNVITVEIKVLNRTRILH